jgi:hypothetical protein
LRSCWACRFSRACFASRIAIGSPYMCDSRAVERGMGVNEKTRSTFARPGYCGRSAPTPYIATTRIVVQALSKTFIRPL